jgi:hypothetical protein
MDGRPAGTMSSQFLFAEPVIQYQRMGGTLLPTSAQILALTSKNDGKTIALGNMRATVLELKKSSELINDLPF